MIQRTVMKSFKYKLIKSQLLEDLNREGQQGWQLVNYYQDAVLLMKEYEQEDSGRA